MENRSAVRMIGDSRAPDGRYARCVDRWVIHGELPSFEALCEAAVPRGTRTVVLDMDRTLYLAHNLGELVGWELGALYSYGSERLNQLEARRGTGRFVWDQGRPWQSLRYLARGGRAWAFAGSYYFALGKLAHRSAFTRRARNGLLGADPYGAIQQVPLLALLHELEGMPLDDATALSRRVIERLDDDQVVNRQAVARLREWCPGVRIVLSSASPQPVVQAAAEMLGVDDFECSEVDVVDGRMTSPFELSGAYLHAREPGRITRPSGYRRNAGHAKIDRLRKLLGDDWNDGRGAVGITDTWYGEDHCWAQHFERVVDINSRSPFAPIVAHDSPLAEVHSAAVLTAGERQRRAEGELEYRHPSRQTWPQREPQVLARAELEARLRPLLESLEQAADDYARRLRALVPTLHEAERRREQALERIEGAVERYNGASEDERGARLEELNASVQAAARKARQGRRVARPLSLAAFEVAERMNRAGELAAQPSPLTGRDGGPLHECAEVTAGQPVGCTRT